VGANIEVNAPARTEDPDNQTNDIAKGVVSTGRDARTVRFVFVSICCGVARLTNPRIFQQLSLAETVRAGCGWTSATYASPRISMIALIVR
jgi:hypothetical protein